MNDNPNLLTTRFSTGRGDDEQYIYSDITLRDIFAAFALAGMMANSAQMPNIICPAAYEYADAMLKEREKRKEK